MSRPKTEDLPDTDPDSSRNQAIRLEQDRILHRNQPLAALMLVGVTLIIAFAYRAGTGSVAWGAAMLALVTIRLMVDHHLWHKNDDAPAGPVWRTAYLAGTLLTGLLWAVASPLFLNGSELAEQSFGVLIIVGVAAGAVPVMSVYTPIYTAYAALVVLPLAAVLAMGQGALHQLLALACLALLAVLIRSARMMSDQLMRAVRQTQQLDAANKSLAGLNSKLEAAMLAAESASRAKGDFLANMSHEIRTPLNAVLGFAQIGARDSVGREAGVVFKHILDAGHHLLTVINDILDFSKIEAGKLTLESAPFRFDEIVREAVDMVAERAQSKGLSLMVRPDAEMSEWVQGDRFRLQQILVNLLSNAVKFTEKGAVSLTIRHEDGDLVRISVEDSGIGMSEDQIGRLFNAFEQADTPTTRNYGGTGLGLAISRTLARMMGGDISLSSRKGEGSCFTVSLPLPAAPSQTTAMPASDQAGPRLAGLCILLVEDVEVNRMILEDMLVHEGAQVVQAENGQQALDRLTGMAMTDIDVVLMDVQMPVMDGFETTRRIRGMSRDLPIIALTAHALLEEREKCLAAGMNRHVTKPIDMHVLVAAILDLVREPGSGTELESAPAPATVQEQNGAGMQIIDWDRLRAQFKPVLVNRLMEMVINNHSQTPTQIRNMLSQRDFAGLAFVAHKLKGMGGNIMSQPIYELGARTEEAARGETDEALQLAEQLAKAMELLLDELTTYQSLQVHAEGDERDPPG